ncbi:hypothetical protein SAT01_35530 [Sinomonas atrocyanea]|nr:hypothetical protein SAT01_35530 [Sinomonas atrocyanea]GGG59556.1 hypothetical protein GCM10007172_08010 [Sinomonas atrocyanea]
MIPAAPFAGTSCQPELAPVACPPPEAATEADADAVADALGAGADAGAEQPARPTASAARRKGDAGLKFTGGVTFVGRSRPV